MIAERWRLPLFGLATVAGVGAIILSTAHMRSRVAGEVCSEGSSPHRRIELVFGLSRKDRADVTEMEWSDFLSREVTPRFPDGLTVIPTSGQWRSVSGAIIREPSRLLLVWAAGPGVDDRVEHIRTAWKREHRQESVLRAIGLDCVSF